MLNLNINGRKEYNIKRSEKRIWLAAVERSRWLLTGVSTDNSLDHRLYWNNNVGSNLKTYK